MKWQPSTRLRFAKLFGWAELDERSRRRTFGIV
jgi:hypothetical protein